MIKILYTALAIVILTGCATKKNYILQSLNTPVVTQIFHHSIGIKTVQLPEYLMHKEIPFLTAKNEIVYLKNRQWVSYLDEHLTNRTINTLQKSLNSPNVYQYPQNSPYKPDIIIQITIHKFISSAKDVTIEVSWQQSDSNSTYSKRFSTKIPINSQEDVVDGMNRAYEALESELIQKLYKTYL